MKASFTHDWYPRTPMANHYLDRGIDLGWAKASRYGKELGAVIEGLQEGNQGR